MITIKYLNGGGRDEPGKELKLETIKDDIFIGLVQGDGIEEVAKEFQKEIWEKRDSAGHFWLLLCECNIGEKIHFLSREFEKRMSFHFVGRTENGWDKGFDEDIDFFLNRSGKIKSLFKLGACSCDFEFAEKILARMICLQSQ